MTKHRDGDVVMLTATIRACNRAGGRAGEFDVAFVNGDRLPLRSVNFVKTLDFILKAGDRISISQADGPTSIGVLKGIFADLTPPQVVYQRDGKWPLEVAQLCQVTRLDGE